MTVSTSNIWKSASASLRQPARMREKNLHIGNTLRDLYFDDNVPKTEGTFAQLLEELDMAENTGSDHNRR
ncbi:hypothetical protein [Pararhizobium arenae]|jgi:hypothetical protein|uniref:hypothetical protein n=1 Tax=Pararhizobium arenae TaxID=1856850 RepID=UPI00117AD3D5|nr:hypothetical protein [Pararhizobium arenae]